MRSFSGLIFFIVKSRVPKSPLQEGAQAPHMRGYARVNVTSKWPRTSSSAASETLR